MDPSSENSEISLQNINVKVEKFDYDIDDCNKVDDEEPWLQEPSTDWAIDTHKDAIVPFTVIARGETLKEPQLCKCTNCDMLFDNTYSLLQHNLEHLTIKLSRCDNAELDLLEPRRDKPTKFIHKCDICEKVLPYRTWHTHMREVHTAFTFPCNKCNKIFKCQRYYNRHVQFVHEGVPRYKSISPNHIKCDLCDAVFDHKSPLATHIRNVHNTQAKCEICDSVLKSKSYLQGHMARVHFNDGKQHVCLVCGKGFKSPRYVRIHMKNSHKLNSRDAKNTKKLEAAKALMKVKAARKKPVFKCEYCCNEYNARYSLENHTRLAHAKESECVKLEFEEEIENKDVGNGGLNYDLVVREIKIEEM